MKRFVVVMRARNGINPGHVTRLQIEWDATLEELEDFFSKVHGKHAEIVEIMETVRYFPERDSQKSPFLEWMVLQ